MHSRLFFKNVHVFEPYSVTLAMLEDPQELLRKIYDNEFRSTMRLKIIFCGSEGNAANVSIQLMETNFSFSTLCMHLMVENFCIV